MILITQSAVTIALFILLIIVDLKLTLIIITTFSLAYGLIYKLNKNLMTRIGKTIFNANQERFAALTEAFGASKEVKVGGLEKTYINRFSNPSKTLCSDYCFRSTCESATSFYTRSGCFWWNVFSCALPYGAR